MCIRDRTNSCPVQGGSRAASSAAVPATSSAAAGSAAVPAAGSAAVPAAGSAAVPAAPAAAPAAQGGGTRIDAELGAHSPSNFYKGLSGNDVVEHGGLFVATYNIPRIGQSITVHVSMPGGYEFDA